MYRIGQEELDAIAKVFETGKLFRYQGEDTGECDRFEQRWAQRLGVRHATMSASGSAALVAALGGLGVGPGDEVLVPAHTYMATAIAVLAVGAIPVIVDIDESIMISPEAIDAAVGPRTKAVIPVHMWGLVCDMDAILAVAKKHNLLVIEDACQCVGGSYKGKPIGSFGHAAAFSFNYFKNLSCGEGGAVVTNDETVAQRARCLVDSCGFFWGGKEKDVQPFAACGARASEIDGAIMNIQLDRLDGILNDLRTNKRAMVEALHTAGFKTNPCHDDAGECSAKVIVLLDTPEQASAFAEQAGGEVASSTRRHTYTDWDSVLGKRGSHHPALDPFTMQENAECRKDYSADQCQSSLDILHRTVMLAVDPDADTEQATEAIVGWVKRSGPTASDVRLTVGPPSA